jgi:hypothetical protein
MPFQNRPGQGALFKNRDHEKNPKSPNLKGDALLELADGTTVELDLAAWTRDSERAGKWLSLSIKLKQERPIRQRFGNEDGSRHDFNDYVNQHGTPVDDQDVPF